MELTPYRTERGLGTLQRQMNQLFDHFLGDGWPGLWQRSEWAPALDITETEEEFVIEAEVPGIPRDRIRISVTGDVLTLSGEKGGEKAEDSGSAHRLERAWGSFTRTVRLPGTVDASKVSAALKDGVLSLRLPKREETKPRVIEVRVE